MGRVKLISLLKRYVKGMIPININVNNVTLEPNELLRGKVAIVTGASRGIGKATAKAMIDSGATVVAIGRDKTTLDEVQIELGEEYLPYICDVGNVEEIPRYIEEIQRKIGNRKIQILVNCAGTKNGNDERFFEYTPEEFDKVIDINIRGMFFWCQSIAKYMIHNGVQGHIVNVISIKGFIGEASPYSVSKWGVTGLTKGLGLILAKYGIVVNGVAPGGTATDMAHFKKGDSMLHMATPSMRLADPNEIANTIVFLASDLGANIIGDVIISDGGQILQYGNNKI